jgi:hypothetical protein
MIGAAKRDSMNKLAGMQAFAHSVGSGGFTGAAKRMGVLVSAVTKHINRLEAEIGAHDAPHCDHVFRPRLLQLRAGRLPRRTWASVIVGVAPPGC